VPAATLNTRGGRFEVRSSRSGLRDRIWAGSLDAGCKPGTDPRGAAKDWSGCSDLHHGRPLQEINANADGDRSRRPIAGRSWSELERPLQGLSAGRADGRPASQFSRPDCAQCFHKAAVRQPSKNFGSGRMALENSGAGQRGAAQNARHGKTILFQCHDRPAGTGFHRWMRDQCSVVCCPGGRFGRRLRGFQHNRRDAEGESRGNTLMAGSAGTLLLRGDGCEVERSCARA
jgi:hypothetical protein